MGTSLAVVVRTSCFDAGGAGSAPGWGAKIPHVAQCSQKKKKKKNHNKNNKVIFFFFF